MEYVVIQASRGEPYFCSPAVLCRFNFPCRDNKIFAEMEGGSLAISPTDGGHIWTFDSLSKALAHVDARREAGIRPTPEVE